MFSGHHMNLDKINSRQKPQLIVHLQQFISDNKNVLLQKVLEQRTRYLTVVLENIFQPHNASAVIRSAECFGVQDVYVIENEYAFSVRKKIVLGSKQWVNLNRYKQNDNNSQECLSKLKDQGYQLIATSLREGSMPLNELKLDKKTALLFGTEETGLSDIAHEMADQCVYIPMQGFTQSLNISVSAAICLQALTNKLKQSNIDWQLSDSEKQDITLKWLVNSAQNGERIVKQWLLDNQ